MRLSHKVIIIIKTRSIILHCFCDKIFSTAQTLKYKNSLYILYKITISLPFTFKLNLKCILCNKLQQSKVYDVFYQKAFNLHYINSVGRTLDTFRLGRFFFICCFP